jgi:tetratricopeptide (TPR) repeat protein
MSFATRTALVITLLFSSLAHALPRQQLWDDATALYREGRWDDALDLFQRGYRLTHDTAYLVNIAYCLRELDRRDEAGAAAQLFLDRARFDRRFSWPQLQVMVRFIAQLAPRQAPQMDDEAPQWLAKAHMALRTGSYERAESLYKEALAKGADAAQALTGLAEVAFQRGDFATAVLFANRAVEAGGTAAARVMLGNSYFRLGRYDAAISVYQQVLDADRRIFEAETNLLEAQRRLPGQLLELKAP